MAVARAYLCYRDLEDNGSNWILPGVAQTRASHVLKLVDGS